MHEFLPIDGVNEPSPYVMTLLQTLQYCNVLITPAAGRHRRYLQADCRPCISSDFCSGSGCDAELGRWRQNNFSRRK
jgi:hypothetical protein